MAAKPKEPARISPRSKPMPKPPTKRKLPEVLKQHQFQPKTPKP